MFDQQGKNMIRKLIAAAALAGVLGMSGCASVPMADRSVAAQAKQFQPAPNKAKVYVYRNEIMGAAIKMPVLIDNQAVGDTTSKTYIEKDLPPGPHTITSKTEKDSSITIDMLAGRIYYIWQEVKMGMFAARSQLHEVDEAKGQAGVRASKLIK
jgi:hypothetical protein